MSNIQSHINIKELENHQRQTSFTSPFAQSIIGGYFNIERKALTVAKVALLLPIATVAFTVIFRRINKQQDQLLKRIKSHTISGEEEYNKLLELYQAKDKFVKALEDISTTSVDNYDNISKKAPWVLRPILNPIFIYNKTSIEIYNALGEKLCLTPKNVTDQQLKEAAVDHLSDWFDDDDDDYAEYAKMLSLRQSGHK